MAQPDALALLQLLLDKRTTDPVDYRDFMRQPLAPGVGARNDSPVPGLFDLPGGASGRFDQPSTPLNLRAVPTQSDWPLSLIGGGYSMGKRFGQTSEPLNLQAAFNAPDLPFGLSGGTSLRPGRGLGGVDLRAYFRQPF